MLATKGMRFPIDVILVCIRWYAAYPLSYRHLEEMMEERGVFVDHCSINRWAIRFLPLLEQAVARRHQRDAVPANAIGENLMWRSAADLRRKLPMGTTYGRRHIMQVALLFN